MTTKKKVPMQVEQAVESARPDPEVVAVAQRRQFSSNEKRRILTLADACTQPGEIGALLAPGA
ncbi:MAG: hypothetical protein AUJ86_09750 [Hydrogenophilaceae bacterium CG1_02_62_390]|nr:MAG: hypothetical protein AUJ86_09750 [Hydrogenophilaceae bacterium CG1_02_62_390]PIX02766.1 MAG: hypothetical protein COZ79_00020 [Hydrogenophilales bacterium CG_4_8_14_3_um_filter_62_83]PIY98982.1 MAG: hypothetical protein COY64_03255 [Hydrogenophilales bacterium CG_4_10_14_0_8_um_filter_62_70]